MAEVLQLVTGADEVPYLGFNPQPKLGFMIIKPVAVLFERLSVIVLGE
jgi:hypothetical protein